MVKGIPSDRYAAEYFLLTLAVFGAPFFNSFFAAFGYTHSRQYYVVFSVTIALSAVLICTKQLFTGVVLNYSTLFCLAVVGSTALSYFVVGYGASYATSEFLYFLLWGVTSLLVGICLAGRNALDIMAQWLDVIWPMLTIGTLAYLARGLTIQWIATEDSGMNYQSASYYAALSFGITYYCTFLRQNDNWRFRWTKSRAYRIIGRICLPLQFAAAMLSGGRGGFLDVCVLSLLITYIELKRRKSAVTGFFTIGILSSLVAYLLWFISNNKSLLGMWRLFAASGREDIYGLSIRLFLEKPIVGYGFFGYIDQLGIYRYPHNIILQLLLSVGLVGTFILVFFFVSILLNLSQGSSAEVYLIVILLTDCLVRLSFSGSFLYDTCFMFIVGYLCNMNRVPIASLNSIHSLSSH